MSPRTTPPQPTELFGEAAVQLHFAPPQHQTAPRLSRLIAQPESGAGLPGIGGVHHSLPHGLTVGGGEKDLLIAHAVVSSQSGQCGCTFGPSQIQEEYKLLGQVG